MPPTERRQVSLVIAQPATIAVFTHKMYAKISYTSDIHRTQQHLHVCHHPYMQAGYSAVSEAFCRERYGSLSSHYHFFFFSPVKKHFQFVPTLTNNHSLWFLLTILFSLSLQLDILKKSIQNHSPAKCLFVRDLLMHK